jgi:hypothetical protein
MHLDAFLDKMKEREVEEEGKEKEVAACIDAQNDDGGGAEPTQLIAMDGDDMAVTEPLATTITAAAEDAPTMLIEMEVGTEGRENEATTNNEDEKAAGMVEVSPPLEAPSPDLPAGYVDAWDNEHIRYSLGMPAEWFESTGVVC